MAHIIIFGGHGKIALFTEALLTRRGDTVTAVIRNPDQSAEVRATGAEPLVADIEQLDTAALAELIAGHDAVVWSAGAGGGNPARTRAVDQDAAIRSMDATVQAGIRRYVMVSYFGSSPEHGVDSDQPFFAYAEAKAAADEHLRALALDWTVLGPSKLTFEASTGKIDASAASSGEVPRATVAEVIAEALVNDATIGRTIRFNEGDVPIAEALSVAG